MSEFLRLDPTKLCLAYGTGKCCHDKHFDVNAVFSTKNGSLCGDDQSFWARLTNDKTKVNCKDCVELLHS